MQEAQKISDEKRGSYFKNKKRIPKNASGSKDLRGKRGTMFRNTPSKCKMPIWHVEKIKSLEGDTSKQIV
jgi:hypothetical protein